MLAQTRWRDVEENLSRDTRFHLPGLTPDLRSRLWDEHMSSLSSRRQGSLESLFERFTATEAKRLDVPFAQIWPKIESDPAVQHLHRSRDEIQEMYEDWLDQRVRVQAKRDLEECMAENSFVEYWGRLKRDARAKDEGTIEEEGSGDGDVEVVDVKQMSQKIDLNEIAAVLKVRCILLSTDLDDSDLEIITCSTTSAFKFWTMTRPCVSGGCVRIWRTCLPLRRQSTSKRMSSSSVFQCSVVLTNSRLFRAEARRKHE